MKTVLLFLCILLTPLLVKAQNNYVVDSSNSSFTVTNFLGGTTSKLIGLPLGTSDGTATGELVLKVKVIGSTATTALTDTQLRATAVPVSGSAAVGSAPTAPPLSVAGVDSAGLKRHILTGVNGAIVTLPLSVQAATSLTATATNANATATLAAAGSGIKNVIDGIAWSYSGGIPVGGRVVISDGSSIVFDEDVTSSGAGFFPVRRKGTANTALTVTLYAGGAGIVGKVNIGNAYTE